ncbi:MAG: YgcG family protein [Burkholderiaceae bacterium]|nr:YgcG family protein [Burkholderiaceae bacterium]
MLRLLTGFLLALLLSTAAAQDFAPIPPLKSRVTDQAGMLKPEQRAALENTLKAHEAKTGNQVAVLLVKSTAPEVIEQYGIRVAEAWKLGRKGVDDGVILIIAKDNTRDLRRMRLEIGRGAEGVIPDVRAKQILQDIIAPKFRENDFYGGLNAGVEAIHALLSKEPFPEPSKARAATGADMPTWVVVLVLLVPFLVIIAIVVTIRRAMNRVHGDGWGRSSGVFLGGGSDWGGWSSGGGGSDGGGFSGGGGDFGGGGASGDW